VRDGRRITYDPCKFQGGAIGCQSTRPHLRKSYLPIFRPGHMRILGVTLRHFERRALILSHQTGPGTRDNRIKQREVGAADVQGAKLEIAVIRSICNQDSRNVAPRGSQEPLPTLPTGPQTFRWAFIAARREWHLSPYPHGRPKTAVPHARPGPRVPPLLVFRGLPKSFPSRYRERPTLKINRRRRTNGTGLIQ
jgi:hypothetical protein